MHSVLSFSSDGPRLQVPLCLLSKADPGRGAQHPRLGQTLQYLAFSESSLSCQPGGTGSSGRREHGFRERRLRKAPPGRLLRARAWPSFHRGHASQLSSVSSPPQPTSRPNRKPRNAPRTGPSINAIARYTGHPPARVLVEERTAARADEGQEHGNPENETEQLL